MPHESWFISAETLFTISDFVARWWSEFVARVTAITYDQSHEEWGIEDVDNNNNNNIDGTSLINNNWNGKDAVTIKEKLLISMSMKAVTLV